MKDIRLIQGRLSNQMFILAAHLTNCWDNNIHFFVQDEKYFKKYADEIKQLYGVGKEIIPNSIDKVAIHMRRGKNPINPEEPAYHENPFYENLSHHEHENISNEIDDKFPDYYAKAISMFPQDNFLVFSDDTEYCKQLFGNIYDRDRFKVIEGQTDVEDLNMMANCKHIIGANSSMSWWAAWLGEYPGRRIIMPKKWFARQEDEKYIGLPSKWERI